jgi:ribosomal protein L37AE/L43A
MKIITKGQKEKFHEILLKLQERIDKKEIAQMKNGRCSHCNCIVKRKNAWFCRKCGYTFLNKQEYLSIRLPYMIKKMLK